MSKCSKCGGPAYLGFTKVECATVGCPNFSKKYCDEQTSQSSQALKGLGKTDLKPSLVVAGTVNPKFQVGDKVKSTLSYLAGTVTGVTLSPKIEYVVYCQNTPLYFFEDELELDVMPTPPAPGSLSGGTVGQNTPTPVANTIVVGSFVYLKATFKRVGIQSCSKGTVVNILYGIPHDTVVVSWPAAPFGNQAPYSRDELELWP